MADWPADRPGQYDSIADWPYYRPGQYISITVWLTGQSDRPGQYDSITVTSLRGQDCMIVLLIGHTTGQYG